VGEAADHTGLNCIVRFYCLCLALLPSRRS